MNDNASGSKAPLPTKWGQTLVAICVGCLVFGNAIVAIFFPHLLGEGMNATQWAILIPIWTIGIVGLLLITLGWIISPARDTQILFEDLKRRPDGHFFSPFTRYLAGLTLLLLVVISISSILFSPSEDLPLHLKGLMYLIMTAPCGFMLYVLFWHKSERNRVVTTYINDFFVLFAFLLIGFFLPLLVIFSLRDRRNSNRKNRRKVSGLYSSRSNSF